MTTPSSASESSCDRPERPDEHPLAPRPRTVCHGYLSILYGRDSRTHSRDARSIHSIGCGSASVCRLAPAIAVVFHGPLRWRASWSSRPSSSTSTCAPSDGPHSRPANPAWRFLILMKLIVDALVHGVTADEEGPTLRPPSWSSSPNSPRHQVFHREAPKPHGQADGSQQAVNPEEPIRKADQAPLTLAGQQHEAHSVPDSVAPALPPTEAE